MRQSISLSIESIGRYLELLKNSIITFYKYPLKKELCIQQLFEIGVLSLPAIAISGFSTGLVLAAQSFFQLADKGLESSTGIMVAKSMVTELGPILAGFIVTGRVGSSISAEIGSMKVTEQIDAMESMSVSPLQYLLIPRILAAALMQPILTIFNCVMGIFGAYLISVYFF